MPSERLAASANAELRPMMFPPGEILPPPLIRRAVICLSGKV
jgi:hypothetical protein